MGITADRDDPELKVIDPETNMQMSYLVLSEEEREKGYIRPVRESYIHLTCGAVTVMGAAIAETYARDPYFYGATYCARCRGHYPVGERGEFVWSQPRKETPLGKQDKVGT